jgi:hypothetical protein
MNLFWQPIATAPIKPFDPEKWFMAHSDYLLVWTGYGVKIANYGYTATGRGRWRSDGRPIPTPTHWMPLPEGPKP